MMDVPSHFSGAMALLTALIACVTDLCWRRIPNVLTFGAFVGAVLFWFWSAGLAGLSTSFGGWIVACLLFLPWFLLGGMGAGDVKLLAALGAWFGPSDAIWLALYGGLAGGVLALVSAFASGYLRKSFSNLFGLLMFWRVAGIRPLPELTLATAGGPRLPYAVPIAVGVVALLWLR